MVCAPLWLLFLACRPTVYHILWPRKLCLLFALSHVIWNLIHIMFHQQRQQNIKCRCFALLYLRDYLIIIHKIRDTKEAKLPTYRLRSNQQLITNSEFYHHWASHKGWLGVIPFVIYTCITTAYYMHVFIVQCSTSTTGLLHYII
mgnify:CR=1 FL=1